MTRAPGMAPMKPSLALMAGRPSWLIAMSFGLGLCRPWPGTWGSAGGFLLFAALQFASSPVRIVIYGVLIALAVAASTRTGNDLGHPDHQTIVVDETLGMSLTLEAVAREPLLWLPAFLLFRFFDITKPWPVRKLGDMLPSGYGVMADDLMAAVYAAALLALALFALGL